MIIAIGLSNYNASIFHLFTHAMFKALLFMSAGSIIHSIVTESQDIRTFGGMLNWTLITYVCLLIGSLSLMAILGLSGFYSKDIIIESSYGIYYISGYIIYWFALISATLTTIYSFRLIYLVFFNVLNANKYSYHIIKEYDLFLLALMVILAIFSIFIGYITRDLYLGMGTLFNSLFTHLNNLSIVETEFNLLIYIKLLLLVLSIFFICSILIIYEFNYKLLLNYQNLLFLNYYVFTNTKFMFDNLFNNYLLRSSLHFSYYLNLYLDKGLLYVFGLVGIFKALNFASYKTLLTSSNKTTIFGGINVEDNVNKNTSQTSYNSLLYKFNTNLRYYNIYLLFLILSIALFIISSLFLNLSNLILLFILFISISIVL